MTRNEHQCDNTETTAGQALQEYTAYLSASRLIHAHSTVLFVNTAAQHQLLDAHT